MLAVSNCTFCQDVIEPNPGRWDGWMRPVETLLCGHELHRGCLQQVVDNLARTEPHVKVMQCLECRGEVPVTLQPSAQQIATWVMRVGRTIDALMICATVYGVSCRTSAKRYWVLSAFVAEGIWMVVVVMGGVWLLSSSGTKIYNWRHGTEIRPRDVGAYLEGLYELSSEEQLKVVVEIAVLGVLEQMQETSTWYPFNEEEKRALHPMEEAIGVLNKNKDFEELMVSLSLLYLEAYAPDVCAQVKKLGVRLTDNQGNEEVKKALAAEMVHFLGQHIVTHYDLPVPDKNLALHMALVIACQWLEKTYEGKGGLVAWFQACPENAWNNEAQLLRELQAMFEVDFATIPAAQLVFDSNLHSAVTTALLRVRKNELVELGLEYEEEWDNEPVWNEIWVGERSGAEF